MRPYLFIALVCCVLPFVGGCGNDNPLGRLPISGKVTLQGRPLDRGDIQFTPVGTLGKTKAGATITEGEYSVPTESGLAPGKYVVRIFSSSGGAAAAKDVMPGMQQSQIARERIPPQYNVNSKLQCEVKEGDDNVFNFDL